LGIGHMKDGRGALLGKRKSEPVGAKWRDRLTSRDRRGEGRTRARHVVRFAGAEHEVTVGILVDEVREVLRIAAEEIEPLPDFGSGSGDTEFILDVGKSDRRVVFLLDIGRVLSTNEVGHIAKVG
jgi:chemotaxis signal transduction protein